MNSSNTESWKEFMSRETLVNKSEQSPDVFYTGTCAKYNLNTSQQSTDTAWNFNCNLSKVSDLPLSALEKSLTATVSCFNPNPEFLSSGSDECVIATSAPSLILVSQLLIII